MESVWLIECLYYDIWQTADEITVDVYINVIVCMHSNKYSLQYAMCIIELVWIFVQQLRNDRSLRCFIIR